MNRTERFNKISWAIYEAPVLNFFRKLREEYDFIFFEVVNGFELVSCKHSIEYIVNGSIGKKDPEISLELEVF